MLHAGVRSKVCMCDEIQIVFAKQAFSRFEAATLLTEATPCLQPLCYRTEAASGRAVRLRFSAGGALDAHGTTPQPFAEHRPSDGE